MIVAKTAFTLAFCFPILAQTNLAMVGGAVQDPQDRNGVVMVAVQGHAQQRTVRLGLHTQTDVEVTDGLAADEAVLVEGQYSLPDGTAIQPVSMAE